jgi:glutathione S-transferase
MSSIISRLDITQSFWEVDEICQHFAAQHQPQLSSALRERPCRSRMHLREVMTIAIAFHGSGFRTFKDFYTLCCLTGRAPSLG